MVSSGPEVAASAANATEDTARVIVEAALDAVVAIDREGRVTAWNPQAEATFGWTRAEAVGCTLVDTIIPQRYRPAHRSGFARYLATRQAVVLNRRIELFALRRNGDEFPIELSIAPIGEGENLGFCAFVRDITERKRAEAALRESEERFRTMADTAPVMIWISGTDKLCTWFNSGWLDFVGRPMERELGNGWSENVHPEDLRACLETYTTSFDTRRPIAMTYRLRRHDGSWRWVVDHGVPRYGSDQEFVGYIGSCIDITEHREAVEALSESREQYQTLAESLPQLVWTCRPDGWCDYLSRQWVEYTGRPAEEQLGYGWVDRLHPDDRERVQSAWAEATVRADRFDIEFRIRRADGAYRWFKTRAVPLRDAAGVIVKWFGSNTDFDEHKRAEARLQSQLERLSLIDRITRAIGERQDLRSIFQVVVRSLEEDMPVDFGCICLHEAAIEALTVSCVGPASQPLALQLALGEDVHIEIDHNGLSRCVRGKLVHEPDLANVPAPFARRLAKGGLRSVVMAPLLVENRVFGVLLAARREARSFSSGDCEFLAQLSGHVALAAHQAQLHAALQQAYDDLRQSQQTVLQQERLRALGQMASGIAHDINNAISPVALYTQSLLEHESALSPRARDYLQTIGRAIDDVAATVARMREFYRAREFQLNPKPVALNDLAGQVLNLTRARWSDMPQKRGIVIETRLDLPPSLPAVMGVESEIREALINLIFNAVDAMPEGGTLTIRTRTAENAAGNAIRVIVEVADTGIGMDEETKRRCLEPFFTTKGERGTGLGLAMVYGMAQRHSAEIEIVSAVGAGTTLRVSFLAAGNRALAGEPARVRPAPMRILLVDDDPVLLKALRDTLEIDGHTIVTASGGREGIEAYQAAQSARAPFDAVITDLGMPYVDGRKVAESVKALSPSTGVIMLTGWGERLLGDGEVPPSVDRLLNKPPKLDELREALARCDGL